jgi:hypothetical protein
MNTETNQMGRFSGYLRSEFETEKHPVLQVVENTEQILWLGVRDGIRNYLITAA